MHILPPTDLLPGQQIIGLNHSLAQIAYAKTREESREAWSQFQQAAEKLRACFTAVQQMDGGTEEAVRAAEPWQIRFLLDELATTEEQLDKLHNLLARLIHRKADFSLPERYFIKALGTARQLYRDISAELIPYTRELRLRIICAVADRAKSAGIDVLNATSEFRDAFLKASLAETMGWQETAHLLADIESARTLQASITPHGTDRTAEIRLAPR